MQKYGLKYNDSFVGILFTSQMNIFTCISGIKNSVKPNQIVEVLLHPASYISSLNEKFITYEIRNYCLNPNRFIEKETLLSKELLSFLNKNKIKLMNHNHNIIKKKTINKTEIIKEKKVIFIFDETEFYHPNLINKLIEEKNGVNVVASIIIKLKNGGLLKSYLLKNWYQIGILNLIKLGIKSTFFKLSGLILRKNKRFFSSCKQVLKLKNIPFKEINDLKSDYVKSWLRKFDPEIIVSSNSLIFDDELLNLPSIKCINRHSSLLPVNGGILPVFRSIQFNHSHTGVTVHEMRKEIDEGPILAQFPIPVYPNDNISNLYKHCFNISYFMIVDAINEKYTKCRLPNAKKSYFSYPQIKDWNQFNRSSIKFN